MANLEDVMIKFKCKYCKQETEISADDLIEAGTEGPPYCSCCIGYCIDLDVIGVYLKT